MRVGRPAYGGHIVHMNAAIQDPSCLLLYVNTLYEMLTPLLNVNTFMECHHLYGMSTSLFQARRSIGLNE